MTRRQLVILAVLGLVALAAWCLVTGIQRSFDPGHYRGFYNHPQDFVPPVDDIAWWSGALAVEVIVGSAILVLARSPAGACAVLAVIAGLVTLGMGSLAMHAPPYYGMHVVFLAFSTVWLLLMAIVAKLAQRRDG
jgi:hypothetical protein